MIPGPVRRFLERRRFPSLMLMAGVLFVINVFVPDPIPFIDELLLLIATVAFGAWRKRKPESGPDKRRDGS